jgi:hypothetical protein
MQLIFSFYFLKNLSKLSLQHNYNRGAGFGACIQLIKEINKKLQNILPSAVVILFQAPRCWSFLTLNECTGMACSICVWLIKTLKELS